ncbi:hypothetical protein MTR67_030656 [Solanum verrucosum]|uniref:Uncharacterized protein n=1 Tax=Solanum verrucosum TaxID=315347 RepID=A0AAF0RE77_SOLVR|nr:hypothetical protein MTR67_030656 [Solanum verrucosum]
MMKATHALEMAQREIGMDPGEDTSCSPPSQRDRFPLEAQSESPVPLIPASLAHVEALGNAVPQPYQFHCNPTKLGTQDLQSTCCSSTKDWGIGDKGGCSVAD